MSCGLSDTVCFILLPLCFAIEAFDAYENKLKN